MDKNNTTAVTTAVNKNLIFENGKNGCLLFDESLKLLVLTEKRWSSLSDDEKKKVLETYGYKKVIEQKDEESGEVKESLVYSDGKSLYIVANEIVQVVNFYEYPLNLLDNARLFNYFYGRDFVYDPERAAIYIFQTLEYDQKLGTSGCYWQEDIKDAKTRKAFDGFAKKMHEALKILVTPYSVGNDEIDKERSRSILKLKDKIDERYQAFSGHSRNFIIERFKDIKGGDTQVEFNDVKKTGSLIPCLNGCYDLTKHGKAGAFRSTRREDYLTMYAPTRYVPNAENEYVKKFLQDVTCNRPELERYLAMSIAVGIDQNINFKGQFTYLGHETNNGKSTFVNALIATLGKSDSHGLAQTIRPEAFSKTFTQGSTLTPDLATIGFARTIFVSEPEKDLKIDAAGLKRLTSPGTQITINPKYAKPYHIEVHFVLYWDTNYEIIPNDPTVYTSGRMRVLPWDFVPKVLDTDMLKKLTSDEAKSAWLWWMIEGHKQYIENGSKLDEPDYCKEMVDAQEKLSDRFGDFLETYYAKSGSDRKNTKLKDMYAKYKDEYREENGLTGQMSYYEFKRALINKGYKIERRSNCDHVIGLIAKTVTTTTLTAMTGVDIFNLTINSYYEVDENGSISVYDLHNNYLTECNKHGYYNREMSILTFIKMLSKTFNLPVIVNGLDDDGLPIATVIGYSNLNVELSPDDTKDKTEEEIEKAKQKALERIIEERIAEYKSNMKNAAKKLEKIRIKQMIEDVEDEAVKEALRTICNTSGDFTLILKALIDAA